MRRAKSHLLIGAPSSVVAIFDHGSQYKDRFTIFILAATPNPVVENSTTPTAHYIAAGDDHFEHRQMTSADALVFRQTYRHLSIRWTDLPEEIRWRLSQ